MLLKQKVTVCKNVEGDGMAAKLIQLINAAVIGTIIELYPQEQSYTHIHTIIIWDSRRLVFQLSGIDTLVVSATSLMLVAGAAAAMQH